MPLNRLTRLYDSVEQLEDLWGDDEGTIDEGEDVEVWEMNEDGQWVEGAADDDEWESAEEGEDEEMHDAMDIEDASGEWSPSTDTVIPPLPAPQPNGSRPTSSNDRPQSPDVPQDAMDVEEEPAEASSSESHWKRFEVLPEAPPDHAFYNSIPAQPSRQFLARLSKEYKALRSSLPGTFRPHLRANPRAASLTTSSLRAWQTRSSCARTRTDRTCCAR